MHTDLYGKVNKAAWRLTLGADQLHLTRTSPMAQPEEYVLDIGVASIARRWFKHEPPSALEVEYAIEEIENKLETWHRLAGQVLPLHTPDSQILDIAKLAAIPLQAETALSRDVVEHTFGRLVAVIQGRPASVEGLPADRLFAARLLILREFMHHMKCESIIVKT